MAEGKFPVRRSMKPMLAQCVHEAVRLALIDSTAPKPDPQAESFERQHGVWSAEERASFEMDIDKLPSDALARMSIDALARNVAVRLLGEGGWMLPTPNGPMYTGNATTREVFDATFDRPDRDQIAELAFDMGLTLREDGAFELPDPPDEDPDATS